MFDGGRHRCSNDGAAPPELTRFNREHYDRLRAALGYSKLVLDGDSYGTYTSFIYMRRHPEAVTPFVDAAILPSFGATRVHLGLAFALVAALIFAFVLARTRWGLEMRAIGQAENNQVPGSYEGTLTSEGRLPSAFPHMRA